MQSILTGYRLKAEFEGKLKSQVKKNMLAVTQPSHSAQSLVRLTIYLLPLPPYAVLFCLNFILHGTFACCLALFLFFFSLSSTFCCFTQLYSVSPLTDASLDVKQKASLQKHNKAQRCQLQDFRVVTNLIHTATFLGYSDWQNICLVYYY